MALPMAMLSRIGAPLVWLLDSSSAVIFNLFGLRRTDEATVTAEELRMIFAEATRSGVIEAEQRQILTGVVRLAERPVREMMTPRMEIDWIEAEGAFPQTMIDRIVPATIPEDIARLTARGGDREKIAAVGGNV